MRRHRYFNLWLHDDKELAVLVQSDIVERVTLHQWPLSCVQQLTTSGGRRLIYKSAFGPTVEAEFYANARSDLLPEAETIYESDGHVCMLLEFIEAPLLKDLDLPEEELVRVGHRVLAQIGQIAGDLPSFVDISSEEKWEELIEGTLKDLQRLISEGKLRRVDDTTVRDLERCAFSSAILAAIHMNPGYLHGDFGVDNIFLTPDGYRVIDWQRPKLGPTGVDLATLMESSGFDPRSYVDEGVVRIMHLLRVHWLAQCSVRWFPEGLTTYDEQIARLASLLA